MPLKDCLNGLIRFKTLLRSVFMNINELRPSSSFNICNVANIAEQNLHPTTIDSRVSLLKDYSIAIEYSPLKGLSATVKYVKGDTFADLPIVGHLDGLNLNEMQKVIRYLEKCYWLPKRNMEGCCIAVEVRPAVIGGAHGKIPFQEGLALGSIVKGEIIRKLKKYADVVSERDNLEEQLNNLFQRTAELTTKKDDIPKRFKDADIQKDLIAAVDVELKIVKEHRKAILTQLKTLTIDRMEEIPVFTHFSSGLTSPIDMNSSPVVVQPRGFDSLHFASQYINIEEEMTDIQDKLNQASSSGSFSANVSGGGWFVKASASFSTSWAKSTADRISTIKHSKKAEGVLVINAMVTTRNVRCFSKIEYDKERLEHILHVMRECSEAEAKEMGISFEEVQSDPNSKKPAKTEKVIYMLTEAVLGGSYTALVTFLNTEEMNRRLEKHAKEQSQATSGSVSVSYFGMGGGASYSAASASAAQTERDLLESVNRTRVEIEIISQGAIPTFARDVIEREVLKQLDLNPAKFEISQQDIADSKKLIGPSTNEEKNIVMEQRRMKMANAQIAVMNTCRGLTAEKQKISLHTSNGVMDAYENFAEQMVSDENCGVPVGFYYDRLSEKDIEDKLAKIRLQEEAEKRKQAEQEASEKKKQAAIKDAGAAGSSGSSKESTQAAAASASKASEKTGEQ